MTRQLTVHGSPGLERRLHGALGRMARLVRAEVGDDEATLLLIGGYGRGEGGVELRGGVEYPHNNFDLLLLTRSRGAAARARLQERLAEPLRALGATLGVGVDLSVIARSELTHGPVRVMWYDLREGHRVLFGDADFLRTATHLTVDRIPGQEIHRLVRNRGTLLLLNRLWIEGGHLAPGSRICVKHRAKAVLGIGDALLHTGGAYHWSYLEKARRIAEMPAAPSLFQELYEASITFRLRPDYSQVPSILTRPFPWPLMRILERIYLDFEAHRRGRAIHDLNQLAMTPEPARSLRSATRDGARHLRAVLTGREAPISEARLDRAFADLLFDGDLGRAAAALRCAPEEALATYVRAWGADADPNFAAVERTVVGSTTQEAS